MKTISAIVRDQVSALPFIEEAMSAGLINLSALARRLQPEITLKSKREVSAAAILMALKRMEPGPTGRMQARLRRFCRSLGDITVRTALSEFTYRNSQTLMKAHASLLEASDADSFCTFSQGVSESTLICSADLLSIFRRELRNATALSSIGGLASVTLRLPEENLRIPGVYYYLLQQLAWEAINIVEVISTSREFTLIVKEKDAREVVRILMRVKTD